MLATMALTTLLVITHGTDTHISDGSLTTSYNIPETNTPPIPMQSLGLSDLKTAGYFLLPTSIVFICINCFLLGILCMKWGKITDSDYRNSCLFCLYLTVADLALSALVGLPVGMRLSFEEDLRENNSMLYYTNTVAVVIYEYVLLLRMLVIAALSVDRCLHIITPFKYMKLATKMRINIVCLVIVCFPMFRFIPMIYGRIICLDYTEPTTYDNETGQWGKKSADFEAPLRCYLDVNEIEHPASHLSGVILPGLTTFISWLTIVVSNLMILSLVIKKSTGFFSRQQREEMNRKLIKSCILIMLVTLIFAITNFPITYVKIASFLVMKSPKAIGHISNKTEFFLLILSFLSLYFNPWLHVMRMRSIKEAVMGIKKRIMRAMSTHSTTVMPSPNPGLSKMSLQAMQTKRKSSAMTSTVREESPVAVRKGTKPNLEQVQEVEE